MNNWIEGIWTKQLLAVAAALLLGLGTAGVASAGKDLGPGETFQTNYLSIPEGGLAAGNSGSIDGFQERSVLSNDGRYVAFDSEANTLDPAADPDSGNVFRKDRTTGAVVLISRATGVNGAGTETNSNSPSTSADGNLVLFITDTSLSVADTDDEYDAYVRDVTAGTTTLVTPGTDQAIGQADLSANGQFVALSASDALVGGDLNGGLPDVYRRDLSLPLEDTTYDLVSKKAVSGDAGNNASLIPSISGDGRWVAYASNATDLVTGFTDNNMSATDLYLRDMNVTVNRLVSSRFDSTTQGGNGSSNDPQIAGTPVALNTVKVSYYTEATNVAPLAVDNNPLISVYRKSMAGTASDLISQSSTGVNGTNQSALGSISDDGNLVIFVSNSDNFGSGSGGYGVYLRNVTLGTTTLISTDDISTIYGAISGNGAVGSWAELGGITSDSDSDAIGVFTRTLPNGPIQFVSRPSGTVPYLQDAAEVDNPLSGARQISADGRYVVFTSLTHRLPGLAGRPTVYRRDLTTGEVVGVSRSTGANGAFSDGAKDASISADGTKVAFVAFSDLTAADDNTDFDVYVRDIPADTTTLASRATGQNGLVGDENADHPAISADGKRVGFQTNSTNYGVPGGFEQVYVRDLGTNETLLASRADGGGGLQGNGDSETPSLSGDGKIVVFYSRAFNFNPDDPNNDGSIYVRNLDTNIVTLVSRRNGLTGANATGFNYDPVISADGTVVAWETKDQEVAPEAGAFPGGDYQVASRVLATGANTLVSREAGGPPSAQGAEGATISGDGSVIAFDSQSTNLLAGLGGVGHTAVFARQMATGALSGPPAFGKGDFSPQYGSSAPSLSDNGSCMAFIANGHNNVSGGSSDLNSQYVFVVQGTCSDPRQDEIVTPPPPPPPPPGDPKPKLTKVKLTKKKFAVAKKPTAKVAKKSKKKRKKSPKGTKLKFRLNVNASLTIRIEKKLKGRKVKGKCRKLTRKNVRKKKCSRFVKSGKLRREGLKSGAQKVSFGGRIGKRKLKPGKYRMKLIAYNSAGASKKVYRPFRIVRR